ncbi:MAG: hypothetical protein HYX29_09785 [Solirubrobacterales bacterium]|nr:hypothetical protein [Solirubrobacterales bacterium]
MAVHSLNTSRAPARSTRLRELGIVFAVWIIASALVAVLAFGVITPRRFVDEFVYWALAGSVSAGEGLTWRGQSYGLGPWVYPILIAPAFRIANSVSSQYELVKAVNAATICAVVFPVYVAARWFVSQPMALLAAVFAISVPALNYAGIVGTENLAYPVSASAFAAMLHALARPGLRPSALAVGLTVLAVAVRAQFALLLPIFAATLLLVALMRGPGKRRAYLSEQRSLIATLGVLAALVGLYALVRGGQSLGLYQSVLNSAALTLDGVWFWLKAFTADVYLLCAIVPAIATFSLLGSAENRRDPLIGALAALALVASISFIAQMTWFSAISTFRWREQHIFYERYMFYLGPIFFIGLVASLRRVTWKAAAASLAVAVLVISGMQSDAITVPFSLDAFGQAYIGFYLDENPETLSHVGMALAGIALLIGLAFVASAAPESRVALRKYGQALAIVLPLFLLTISQAKAWSYQQLYAESLDAQEPVPKDWISRATSQRVAMLIPRSADPTTFYQSEFWNPNVDRAYASTTRPIGSRPVYSPTCPFRTTSTGEIRAVDAPGCESVPTAWLVESDIFSMHLRNETERAHPSTGRSSTLMISSAPARVLSMVAGRNVVDESVETALEIRTYSRESGQVRIVASSGKGRAHMRAPDGSLVTVLPERSTTLEYETRPGTQLETYLVKDRPGSASKVNVDRIEFREGDGPWRSID